MGGRHNFGEPYDKEDHAGFVVILMQVSPENLLAISIFTPLAGGGVGEWFQERPPSLNPQCDSTWFGTLTMFLRSAS